MNTFKIKSEFSRKYVNAKVLKTSVSNSRTFKDCTSPANHLPQGIIPFTWGPRPCPQRPSPFSYLFYSSPWGNIPTTCTLLYFPHDLNLHLLPSPFHFPSCWYLVANNFNFTSMSPISESSAPHLYILPCSYHPSLGLHICFWTKSLAWIKALFWL